MVIGERKLNRSLTKGFRGRHSVLSKLL